MPLDDLTSRALPARLAPASLDEANRTIWVTFATEAGVPRRDIRGPYIERLSLAGMRPERLKAHGPVLDAHQQREARNVLGAVLDVKVQNGEARALVKISERPDVDPLWHDIKSGIQRAFSVGYSVDAAEETVDPATGERIMTAVIWTPHEISLVPVAADPAATVRGKEGPMPEPVITTPSPPTTPAPPPPLTTRAAVNQEIRSLAAGLSIDRAVVDGLIDREATIDEARAAILDDLRRRSATPIRTAVGPNVETYDNPAFFARALADAMHHRLHPIATPPEAARPYLGRTIPEIAEIWLRQIGVPTIGLSPTARIERALMTRASPGLMITSDFPGLLADVIHKELRPVYDAATSAIKQVARQSTVADFRTKSKLMLGELPLLQQVNEHGEFKAAGLLEGKESYRAYTYGLTFGLSRQVLINDDIGAFADIGRRAGPAVSDFEAQTLVDLLVSNAGAGPTLSDNVAVFHANHGNLAAAGAAIAETTLSAGRLAMRSQKGLAGRLIAVTPKFLLVPSALETTATKALAAVSASETFMTNPFAGALTALVEPRLPSASRWYIVGDGTIDGLEYAYLAGQPGPQIESRAGWEVDGVEFKIRLDFGCGFLDYRNWYMNPGA